MDKQKRKLSSYDFVINSPVGKLGVMVLNNRVVRLDFLLSDTKLIHPQNLAIRQIAAKIKKYFHDSKFKFELETHPQGTLLQKKIWQVIQKIPIGKTITYGEIADKLNTSPRVVGNACGRNPMPIIIPCHRVVAALGLGGYCGGKDNKNFIKIKEWLLKHEGNDLNMIMGK